MILWNMRACMLISLIVRCSLIMGCCIMTKRKLDKNVAKYHAITKEPIAVDDLLRLYEQEHYHFHQEKANENNILSWPHLEEKNLDEFCQIYLHDIIPTIKIHGVTGTKDYIRLRYKKESISDFSSTVTALKCERWKSRRRYYLTRAPESECIYSLARDKGSFSRFTVIINKHCIFKWPTTSTGIGIYRDRDEIIEKLHNWTGQPIAKEKYIREYEQEHHELFQKEASGDYLPWPHIKEKKNLDEYCCQYLERCNPKKRGIVKGIENYETLKYHYFCDGKRKFCKIITIKCTVMIKSQRLFYITRAPEIDCVYALLRKSHSKRDPFNIIFKHCDFIDFVVESSVTENSILTDTNVLPHHEIKEERSDAWRPARVQPEYDMKKENLDSLQPLQLFLSN